jgi:hypothetical protein
MRNELIINGQSFGIEDEIKCEFNSPFIDRTQTLVQGNKINPRGEYLFPFNKSGEPKFNEAVGNAHILQSNDEKSVINDVKLLSDGVEIDKGKMEIRAITHDLNSGEVQYELNVILGDKSEYIKKINDRNVNSLAMNGIITIDNEISRDSDLIWGIFTALNGNPAVPGSRYFEYAWDDFSGFHDIVNLANDFTDEKIAYTSVFASDIMNNPDEYISFPTMRVVNKNWTGWINYAYVPSPMTGLMKIPTYYKWNQRVWTNPLGTSGGFDDIEMTMYEEINNQIVPMYNYKKVLEHCFSEFGYTLKGDLLNDETFSKLTIANTYSILKRERVWSSPILEYTKEAIIFYRELPTEINPKNHLPNIKIIDFINDFMKMTNSYISIDSYNVATINQYKAHDIDRELSHGAVIRKEYESNKGIRLGYDLDKYNSYELEQANNDKYSDITNIYDSTLSPVDSLFIDEEYNTLNTVDVGFYRYNSSNLFNYYTGSGNEMIMSLAPVNMANVKYTLDPPINIEVISMIGYPYIAWIPIINDDIYYKMTDEFQYRFEYDEEDFGTYARRRLRFFYESFVNGSDNGSAYFYLGIYHGVRPTKDMLPNLMKYPYMSNHSWVPGKNLTYPAIKLGDWHLGIHGHEGIIDTHYKNFLNIYDAPKVTISNTDSWQDIKKHKWNKTILLRGVEMYVSVIRFILPLNTVEYDCYPIRKNIRY